MRESSGELAAVVHRISTDWCMRVHGGHFEGENGKMIANGYAQGYTGEVRKDAKTRRMEEQA